MFPSYFVVGLCEENVAVAAQIGHWEDKFKQVTRYVLSEGFLKYIAPDFQGSTSFPIDRRGGENYSFALCSVFRVFQSELSIVVMDSEFR